MKIPICEGTMRVTITQKHESYFKKGAYLGITLGLSVFSLVTDIMGKEGYIKHVQEHWLPSMITGPIAAIVVISCLITFVVNLKKEKLNYLIRRD